KAEMSKLRSQFSTSQGQAKAEVQTKMDAAKTQQQSIEARIKAEMDRAQADRDAKIAALQQKASQADSDARKNSAGSIDQVRLEYKQEADALDQTLVHAEQAMTA